MYSLFAPHFKNFVKMISRKNWHFFTHEKFRENDFQFLSYCTLTKNKEGESLETLYSPEVEERKKSLNAAKEYIENYFKRKT